MTQNVETIRWTDIEALRQHAIDTDFPSAWRRYVVARFAYRQWTLRRLHAVETDGRESE